MRGIQKYREGGGRIDLHLHTTNSDGDNTPDEVFRLAAQVTDQERNQYEIDTDGWKIPQGKRGM